MSVRVDPTTLPDAAVAAGVAVDLDGPPGLLQVRVEASITAALEVLIEDPHTIERAAQAIRSLDVGPDGWDEISEPAKDRWRSTAGVLLRAAFGAAEEPAT